LNDIELLVSSKRNAAKIEEFIQIDHLMHTLAVRAAFYIKQTRDLMQASKADRKT